MLLVEDPEFDFLFEDHEGLMDPEALSQMQLSPDLAKIHRALQLISLDITALAGEKKSFSGVQFGFGPSESFDVNCFSTRPPLYTIMFSVGMYQRLFALFRQLTLANAFGRYSQWTDLTMESLTTLWSIPGIREMRIQEVKPSMDNLLNLRGAEIISPQTLLRYISQPPADSKHQFDMQTLLIPALVFAYWHELAHIIYGHLDWRGKDQGVLALSERAGLEEAHSKPGTSPVNQFRWLEYWADDFAARRIALDILRSANVETQNYVLGPFWFNRENFNTFGQLEGFPDEKIEFNLEGFLYRVAFGLIGLVLQFEGFFDVPYRDRTKSHPHAEVRLSHIVGAIYDQLRGGSGIHTNTFLSATWADKCGYAIQTAELTLIACGASRTPIFQDGRSGEFHNQEIQAKTKKLGEDARQMSEDLDSYRHVEILRFMDPSVGITLPLPHGRKEMLGFDVTA